MLSNNAIMFYFISNSSRIRVHNFEPKRSLVQKSSSDRIYTYKTRILVKLRTGALQRRTVPAAPVTRTTDAEL